MPFGDCSESEGVLYIELFSVFWVLLGGYSSASKHDQGGEVGDLPGPAIRPGPC